MPSGDQVSVGIAIDCSISFDPVTSYFSTPNFGLYFGVLIGIGLSFCLLLRGNMACKA